MASILDDSQHQPPNVYAEGTWLHGAIVTGILYGIVVVLYFLCCRSLHRRIRSYHRGSRKHRFIFIMIYVNFVFALSTLYVVSNAQITQLGFINHRDYPGGPSAYEINTASAPLNVAFVVSNWCADALMVWRCVIVYRDSRLHFVVTAFGSLLLLTSVVTGSLWVVIVSRPPQSTSGWMSFTLLFPYISVGLAINIFISVLTVLRLLYHRARISSVLGPEYGKSYASFATIIVESAAVYSICSLLYLVPYAMDCPLANAFVQILGEAQVIAPLLIIYRVSEGKAWTKDMTTCLTSSDSRTTRPLACKRTPVKSYTGKLNVQVELECVRHTDYEGSVRFVDDTTTLTV